MRGTTLAARGWTAGRRRPLGDDAARLDADGCARYVVTDVRRDGTLTGPNLDLLREVCARTDAAVVASGGVSSPGRPARHRRAAARVEGAIVGKALYAGAFTPAGGAGRGRGVSTGRDARRCAYIAVPVRSSRA